MGSYTGNRYQEYCWNKRVWRSK